MFSTVYSTLINFSYLVAEGRAGQPKMMTVGLHCRLARPARAQAIADFVDYAKSFGREVWICTREQIANHWYENHLPRGVGSPITPGSFASAAPSSFGSSSSGGYGGYGGNSSGGTTPGASAGAGDAGAAAAGAAAAGGRFSFLGNLTTPREEQSSGTNLSNAAIPEQDDGDII